jgi:thymidylate synthase ThyX
VVHVAVEEISILASKVIEDSRLASFTEKSTRYVPFDSRDYHTPGAFAAGPAAAAWRRGIGALMSTYDRLMEPLVEQLRQAIPPKPGQSERGHLAACRAQACDVLRYLLPAATWTNIGITANARALEGLLVKMLSHPLEEVRECAGRIKRESMKIVPTLIKYAEPSEYRMATPPAMERRAAEFLAAGRDGAAAPPSAAAGPDAPAGIRLLQYDADAETRVARAILAAASSAPADDIAAAVDRLDDAGRRRLIAEYLGRRGPHDPPLRALEATHLTFEIVMDYGAWRDLQRHRLLTPVVQRLGIDLGYERPAALAAAGMADDFDRAMEAAAAAWRELAAAFPEEAAYVIPLAFRTRIFLTMNLRELHHLVALRSARQGHPSYRRVAQAIYRELERVLPGLASFVRVDLADYDLSRA